MCCGDFEICFFFGFPPQSVFFFLSNTDVGLSYHSIPQCLLFTLSVNVCQPWAAFFIFFFLLFVWNVKYKKTLFRILVLSCLLFLCDSLESENTSNVSVYQQISLCGVCISFISFICIHLSMECTKMYLYRTQKFLFLLVLFFVFFFYLIPMLFFRFVSGEPLWNVYRELQGWRWLYSCIVERFQSHEQCT